PPPEREGAIASYLFSQSHAEAETRPDQVKAPSLDMHVDALDDLQQRIATLATAEMGEGTLDTTIGKSGSRCAGWVGEGHPGLRQRPPRLLRLHRMTTFMDRGLRSMIGIHEKDSPGRKDRRR
ncbi:MAG: hypothetical protein ACYCV7_16265, partial [Acidimicrobiales bacterium]